MAVFLKDIFLRNNAKIEEEFIHAKNVIFIMWIIFQEHNHDNVKKNYEVKRKPYFLWIFSAFVFFFTYFVLYMK